jgi:hypothetical protein
MEEKILEHYRNWLKFREQRQNNLPPNTEQNVQVTLPTPETADEDVEMAADNSENLPNNETFSKFPVDSHNAVKVFENDQIEIYIKKTFHQRQVKFRIQDSMFHIKVKTKENSAKPLLFDLLEVFERAFTYILKNLQSFYNSEDTNEMYLTLFQDNMINGLNSPAVKLQDDPKEVVDNILDMLISEKNIDLEINDTLTVYIHVLSIDHMEFRKRNPIKKQKNKRKKYGARRNKVLEKRPFYWEIEIPEGYGHFPNIFTNKCLLVSIVLGHLQNEFYRSNKLDKRIIYAQNIHSKIRSKQIHAGNIIQKEVLKVSKEFDLSSGPFEISKLASQLCTFYKCQLFVFNGLGHKMCLKSTYPSQIDNSLEPIYLFEPPNEDNHISFIRSISSFFKANGRICFYCKRYFRNSSFIHRCIP